MKKRVLSLLLTVALLVGLLPTAAFAADRKYGDVPIYFGDVYIDYIAEEILKEIDLEGKNDVERIRAVYDWIVLNCERYGTGDTLYVDMDRMEDEIEDFYEYMVDALADGDITLRLDVAESMGSYDPESGYYYLNCDSNEYVAYAAAEMMLYRVGECHNFSALLIVLLGHLGYDCRMIDGDFLNNDGSAVMHKWNMVLLEDGYEWLDVRMDHANYERTGKLSYTYFLVEDTAQWEKKHSWDHGYSDAMMENAQLLVDTYGLMLELPEMVKESILWDNCSDWAETYLKQAVEMEIYPDVFLWADMTKPVTRAEFASVAVMFYEALTGETVDYGDLDNPFSDVSDDQTDVLAAAALGVVKGTGGDKFDPNGSLTREQAVTMLGRVVELAEFGEVDDGSRLELGDREMTFPDQAAIGSWAANYVNYFVSHKVVDGTGDGTFAPTLPMTREQAMKVAVAALDN
ncbi:MAG: S-layer homology domain-containing protein [Clostridia bacterium]|nr:S-layer homology domain-containing protein [Clostridia bacterium]